MDRVRETGLDGIPLEALVEQLIGQAAERIYQASREGLPVARAWTFQDPKQVAKYGKEQASFYVGWYDPEGRQRCKSCGPGPEGKKAAGKLKRQVEAQLLTGTYEANCNKRWAEFRPDYEAKIAAAKAPPTREQVRMAFDNFERIVAPKKVSAIKTATIDQFVSARRVERHRRRPEVTVSPETVNTDLRYLKAALKVACEWGYLKELPRFRFLKVPHKLPVYVLPEHFAALYRACDQARLPEGGPAPADWWRALLVMAYVATGWRIGQLLGLKREDLDLEARTALAAADVAGNKGKQEVLFRLHPLAVEHLRRLPADGPKVFGWPHSRRTLSEAFTRLCQRAGVPHYGFHALRKGFGSLNAARLSLKELQQLMQHKSSQTTMQYYVNPLAEQEATVLKLFVPPEIGGAATGPAGPKDLTSDAEAG